jgi:hypothetical protein
MTLGDDRGCPSPHIDVFWSEDGRWIAHAGSPNTVSAEGEGSDGERGSSCIPHANLGRGCRPA